MCHHAKSMSNGEEMNTPRQCLWDEIKSRGINRLLADPGRHGARKAMLLAMLPNGNWLLPEIEF